LPVPGCHGNEQADQGNKGIIASLDMKILSLGFAGEHRGTHDQRPADEQHDLGGQVTNGRFGDLNQVHD
jgi:hypothetical protein